MNITLGPILALGSALLFGISTPIAKSLLKEAEPLMLAGLMYLGAGLGLSLYAVATGDCHRFILFKGLVGKGDWRWLTGAILTGGMLGPVFLMTGLSSISASTASLLLTLEGVFTACIAWFAFKEQYDARIVLGMAALTAGAITIAWNGGPVAGTMQGLLAVVAACLCWGLDNNFTRKISLGDPVRISALKGLTAGGVNTFLALSLGIPLPPTTFLTATAMLGLVCYGLSLVLFVLSLRHLGASRTGAYFSLAPFIGTATAVAFLGDLMSWSLVAGGGLMAIGVWLHLTERHEHEHVHDAICHSHWHKHDDHHTHEHGPDDSSGQQHQHRHTHARLQHCHTHYPDFMHIHPH